MVQGNTISDVQTTAPLYIPLWEKMDIRLAPRQLAQRTAQDRLRQLSEKLLIDWASQN